MAQLIGITGGIGSGKSEVSNILRNLGFGVYITDTEAKRIMQQDATIKKQIISLFGQEAYTDSRLNNKTIADKVFNNKPLLQQLNDIVHPAVKNDLLSWCEQQTEAIAFVESAILFESGFDRFCSSTIAVVSPMEIRLQRTSQRDNCSRKEVERRINNQMSDQEHIRLATYTINNDSTLDNLAKKVESIVKKLTICE